MFVTYNNELIEDEYIRNLAIKISPYRKNIFNVGYHSLEHTQLVNLVNNILSDKLHFRLIYARFKDFDVIKNNHEYKNNLFFSRPLSDFNKINFYLSASFFIEVNINDLLPSSKKDYLINKLNHGYAFVVFVLDENNNYITPKNVENFNTKLFKEVICEPTYETLNQRLQNIQVITSNSDDDAYQNKNALLDTDMNMYNDPPQSIDNVNINNKHLIIPKGKDCSNCYDYLFNDCSGGAIRTSSCFKPLKSSPDNFNG